MQAALRFVSLVLIVIGLMLLGGDVITSLEQGGDITIRSLNQVWIIIYKLGNEQFKAWMMHHLPVGLMNGVEAFLRLPGWAVFGVAGVIMAFVVGRKTAEPKT